MEIIDGHAHIGATHRVQRAPEALLAEMDESQVARAVICTMGAGIVCRNREGNDEVGVAVRRYPDRFYGFAAVNPWYGAEAVAELRRAVTGLGLCGLKLHPAMQGFHAHDELVYPVVEEAIRLGVPIYVHTGTPVYSLPLQVLELARRYPEGRFVLGHMGGADFYIDVPLAFAQQENVYLETSLTCHAGYVEEALAACGADRVLFGSDSPTSLIKTELKKIEVLNLADDVRARVLGGNLRQLLYRR